MAISLPGQSDGWGEVRPKLEHLQAGWDYTARRLPEIGESLNRALESLDVPPFCVFLAGSYGRLEAGPPSDADPLIIYAEEPLPHDQEKVQNIIHGVFEQLAIPLSNPKGVFTQQFTITSMIAETGSHQEGPARLSQRMLLLMESRCVYGEQMGARVISRLLDHYFVYHSAEPSKEAVFLLNDAVRYFRHICVNYQFDFHQERERWALRNIKLRHSRVVMYSGLALLVLNASQQAYKDDKRAYLVSELPHPPTSRIARVLRELGENAAVGTILGCYDKFLGAVRDPEIRRSLQLEYDDRRSHPLYSELSSNADMLMRALGDVIYGQRNTGHWSKDALDYLIL